MKNLLIFSTIFALSACTPIVKKDPQQTIQINQPNNSNYSIINKKHDKLLKQGEELAKKGDRKDAIIHYFNPVIKEYEKTYDHNSKRIYSARTEAEYDFYSLTARNEGKIAHVLSETWSRAYFLKAYTLLELKELNLAEKNIRKALYLSPSNSRYLSELGYIKYINKDWREALNSYKLAEKTANLFSPKALKEKELLHAKRGIGYSYIELKEFNKAEAIYHDILKIKPRDKIALKGLRYIRRLKK